MIKKLAGVFSFLGEICQIKMDRFVAGGADPIKVPIPVSQNRSGKE